MMKGLRAGLVVVVLIACIALGVYFSTSRKPEDRPVTTTPTPPKQQTTTEKTETVKVYRVAVEDNQTKLRATERAVPKGEDPAETALRCLIEQGNKSDLGNPIPEGTRLLGLKVAGDLATVNLSKEFRDNFAGGSEEEGLTIGAILRTLGQFPKIRRVVFLVEGSPLETLGHLDLSGPQDVTWVGSQFDGVEQ